MTVLSAYLFILGLGAIALAPGVPRLKSNHLHWIYLILPSTFITEYCTHYVWTTHHPNSEIYWGINLCVSFFIFFYIHKQVTSEFRKKLIKYFLILVISCGVIYPLLTHFKDLIPKYFIAISDFFIIVSIFVFYYDLLNSKSDKPLLHSGPFLILSWILLYLGIRFPYLMVVEILAHAIDDTLSALRGIFAVCTLTFYSGLIIFLAVSVLKQNFGRTN